MSKWLLLPGYLQKLWLVHSIARDRSLLNIGADIVIKGIFPEEILMEAFFAAVKEHEAFRLQFSLRKAGPECRLCEVPVTEWRVVDFDEYADPIPEEVYHKIAKHENIPLSPENAFLVRATLYLLGHNKAMLAITAHHLVADAWTIRVLVQDILHHWRRIKGENVTVRTKSDRLTEVLAHKSNVCPTDVKACSDWGLGLPLDHVMAPKDRSGKGGEVSIRLDADIYNRFCRRCAEISQTPFAGLTGAVLILLARICKTSTVETGVLVTTRDLRHQRRMAGCFVQAVPISMEITAEVKATQVIQKAGRMIREKWLKAKLDQGVRESRFPVMISMVRDSSVPLYGPSGINVRYERRRRIQAECDLHIFVYEYAEGVEIVFNYDIDVLTPETVTSWAHAYRELIEHITRFPQMPVLETDIEPWTHDDVARSSPVQCQFQHIGLAVWELDIGLRRLASVGIVSQGQSWEDRVAGVAMALAGPTDGIQLEIVAPLRENAPCVGALVQKGEGPYHCCWRVTDIDAVLNALNKHDVRHTVIHREGTSGLFPSETITFVVIYGFGLIEFLHGISNQSKSDVPVSAGISMCVCIESNDIINAQRFMTLMGYRRIIEKNHEDQLELWWNNLASLAFGFSSVKDRHTSGIAWVACTRKDTLQTRTNFHRFAMTEQKDINTWWSRLRVDPATS